MTKLRSNHRPSNGTVKFIQSLQPIIYAELKQAADKRGINVQEMIRAIILPDFFERQKL